MSDKRNRARWRIVRTEGVLGDVVEIMSGDITVLADTWDGLILKNREDIPGIVRAFNSHDIYREALEKIANALPPNALSMVARKALATAEEVAE